MVKGRRRFEVFGEVGCYQFKVWWMISTVTGVGCDQILVFVLWLFMEKIYYTYKSNKLGGFFMKFAKWEQALELLAEHLSTATINRWFKNVLDVDQKQSTLYIKVHSEGQAEWMESHYSQLVKEAMLNLTEQDLDIVFVPNEDTYFEASYNRKIVDNSLNPIAEQTYSNIIGNFNPRYTFDNFVVGKNNRFAHAAALAVSDKPTKNYNPLFIHGQSGLGKTHLMHAIGHRVMQLRPHTNIVYVSTETFTNEFINSVRQGNPTKFKNRYRNADIFLVDDIQFLSGKEGTQEEFFHTFNHLYEQGKQIIISSDRPPNEIATLEERLSSRFTQGLITDIQPPDFETRVAILKNKAELENMNITDEALEFIAENVPSNIRELEGTLNRVRYYSSLNGNTTFIQLQDTTLALEGFLPNKKQALSASLIKSTVADYFHIKTADLDSPRRDQSITKPRHISMYLCQNLLNMSLTEIGENFGKRDHTTVMHATKKVTGDLDNDPNLQKQIKDLTEMLS